jgi:putative FmdB family regulatory protein
MPIYEYRCQSCQHELEKIQKISDEALKICPECNQSTLIKKVSASGFRLKGSGWYETDFKTGNKKNLAGEKSEAACPAPAAGSGCGDCAAG